MTTWRSDTEAKMPKIGARGWLRVLLRGVVLGGVIAVGLILMLILRLIERPLCGLKRPVTPYITQFVCRLAFIILGIGFRANGQVMDRNGAIVANHSSWLDVFALNARGRIYFVSKAEVANWPVIGWLARATGTVFIARDPKQARQQKLVFEERLKSGHKLVFFPEGTSTEGLQVLSFKSTLFAAFFTQELSGKIAIQPASVKYTAPEGEDIRFYGWWGDMNFGPHLLKILATKKQGSVDVTYHAPLEVAYFDNRKDLAKASEDIVRSAIEP